MRRLFMRDNKVDLSEVARQIAVDGYVYIEGWRADMDYGGDLAALGPLIPQYAGEIVRDVKVDPRVSGSTISPYNTSELTPHTEWFEFPGLPPRYVALWCVHRARGRGGATTLADGRPILRHFTSAEMQRLLTVEHEWMSEGSALYGSRTS
jgi:hypothetical protein